MLKIRTVSPEEENEGYGGEIGLHLLTSQFQTVRSNLFLCIITLHYLCIS